MSESGCQEPATPPGRPPVGNQVTVVLGAQWGDEGKGKVVDLLAQDADMVCRCQVGVAFTKFAPLVELASGRGEMSTDSLPSFQFISCHLFFFFYISTKLTL